MYDSYEDARMVVNDLETAGIPYSDISLIANTDAHGRYSGISSTAVRRVIFRVVSNRIRAWSRVTAA